MAALDSAKLDRSRPFQIARALTARFTDLFENQRGKVCNLWFRRLRWVVCKTADAAALVKSPLWNRCKPNRDNSAVSETLFELLGFEARPYPLRIIRTEKRHYTRCIRLIYRPEIIFYILSQNPMLLV